MEKTTDRITRINRRRLDPLPISSQTLFDQKGAQGYQGDHLDDRHGPTLDGATCQRGEDEQGVEGIAGRVAQMVAAI